MRQHQSIPNKTFDDLINYVSSHADLKTILLADNPRLKGFWQPPTLLGKKARPVSLQFVLDQQRVSIDLLTKLDKSVPNITVIPTLDYICFDQQCPMVFLLYPVVGLFPGSHFHDTAGSKAIFPSPDGWRNIFPRVRSDKPNLGVRQVPWRGSPSSGIPDVLCSGIHYYMADFHLFFRRI
jgi:hypothetical protein